MSADDIGENKILCELQNLSMQMIYCFTLMVFAETSIVLKSFMRIK